MTDSLTIPDDTPEGTPIATGRRTDPCAEREQAARSLGELESLRGMLPADMDDAVYECIERLRRIIAGDEVRP